MKLVIAICSKNNKIITLCNYRDYVMRGRHIAILLKGCYYNYHNEVDIVRIFQRFLFYKIIFISKVTP